MLTIDLNESDGIAVLKPAGKLSESDFKSAAKIIDPYIEKVGKLNGLIIHTSSFPGWDSFSAMMTHLSFVKNHHKNIRHVALATDSPAAGIAEQISSHFVSAKIKTFSFDELEIARQWVLNSSNT